MNAILSSLDAGHVLAVILFSSMVVLALRMADETTHWPRNHLIIAAGALLAFALVHRIVDVLQHLAAIRWSAVVSAAGVLAFLAADQVGMPRRRRSDRAYDGPERRRRPRLGTDPDEAFERDEDR